MTDWQEKVRRYNSIVARADRLPDTSLMMMFKAALQPTPGFSQIEEMHELMCIANPALRATMTHQMHA